MNIQWYPGHMAKAKRLLTESLSLVDIVIELLDARIPQSSRNPDIAELAKNKKRVIVFNKSDLADDACTDKWMLYYQAMDYVTLKISSTTGNGMNKIADVVNTLMKEKRDRLRERGRLFVPARAMIVGIPNVGKSTFINKYTKASKAKAEDRPGVTRSNQWIKIKDDFELLDTPGLLWHKFDDPEAGKKLAITGAIKDVLFDNYSLSIETIRLLNDLYSNAVPNRYKIETADNPEETLNRICVARGYIKKGGIADVERGAMVVIKELRDGQLGRITLELP
jgi:ribosome biogenesis GTPase A